jgi:hypothetical protein
MLKVFAPRHIVPADPLIPDFYPPGRTRKLNTADHLPLRPAHIDQVLKLRPESHGISQIVIPADKVLEKLPLFPSLYQLYIQRQIRTYTAGQSGPGCIVCRRCNVPPCAFPRSGLLTLRKLQKPLAFQPLQQIQTLAGFEPAIYAPPIQQFAHRVRKLGSADPCTGLDHFLDQAKLFAGKFPATESLIFYCADHAHPPLPFSHSKEMEQDPAENDHFRKKCFSSLLRTVADGGPKKWTYPSADRLSQLQAFNA